MSIDGVSTSIMQIEIPSDGLLPGCQHSYKMGVYKVEVSYVLVMVVCHSFLELVEPPKVILLAAQCGTVDHREHCMIPVFLYRM
jgi:hypothetical protein